MLCLRSFLQRHGAWFLFGIYLVWFLGFFQDTATDSHELTAAACAFGTAPSPGYALLHALTPLSFLVPFGSQQIGLIVLNGLLMGIALYHFARFSLFLIDDPLAALIPPAGFMASVVFFRGSFLFSPIPITFLCIIVLLRLLQWPLVDARRLWAATFVMGLGFFGVHPVFRLLLAPFLFYVLWRFPAHQRAVAAAPLFGLAGAAVAIFLPLAAHRFHPALSNPSSWKGFVDTLFLRPELSMAGPRAGSVHAFVWWPEVLTQLERFGESFPVEMLPLVLAGLWPQKRHTPFLVLLGLGVAEWVWAVWMMPGQNFPSGWLLSAALWIAFARGVQLFARKFETPTATTIFTTFFLILGPLSAWLSDGGERFSLQPSPLVAEWETLASFPENGGTWVLDPVAWSSVQGAIASFPRGKVTLMAIFDAQNIPHDAWVTPWPTLQMPSEKILEPTAPLTGRFIERTIPHPVSADAADTLARKLLLAAQGQPSFARSVTARHLTSWGFVFLHNGQLRAASRMAHFSQRVLVESPWNLLLRARIEQIWDRHENARMLLQRAISLTGSEPVLYRELAETNRHLAFLERTPPSARFMLLQEALSAALRAQIFASRNPEIAQLIQQLKVDLQGFYRR